MVFILPRCLIPVTFFLMINFRAFWIFWLTWYFGFRGWLVIIFADYWAYLSYNHGNFCFSRVLNHLISLFARIIFLNFLRLLDQLINLFDVLMQVFFIFLFLIYIFMPILGLQYLDVFFVKIYYQIFKFFSRLWFLISSYSTSPCISLTYLLCSPWAPYFI